MSNLRVEFYSQNLYQTSAFVCPVVFVINDDDVRGGHETAPVVAGRGWPTAWPKGPTRLTLRPGVRSKRAPRPSCASVPNVSKGVNFKGSLDTKHQGSICEKLNNFPILVIQLSNLLISCFLKSSHGTIFLHFWAEDYRLFSTLGHMNKQCLFLFFLASIEFIVSVGQRAPLRKGN